MKKLLLLLVFLLVSFSLYAQNFWVSTNGPNRGSVRALAINSSGHIFAGTYGSGVFRSTDNGNTWTNVNNDNLRYCYVYALAINSSGYIFAGTYGSGVFRSTDNGNTWTQINNGLTNIYVYSLTVSSNGYIFAGTTNDMFRSTDNGNNWTSCSFRASIYSFATSSVANSAIYAAVGNYSNIYRSTDNGNNWNRMLYFNTVGLPDNYFTSIAINSKGNILAGNNYYWGVYRSTDNGNTWTQLYTGGLSNIHVVSLAINSADDIFAGTESDGVFRSTDNGNTWTQINTGLTDSYIRALAINSGEFIFAGTNNGNGVFRSVEPTAYSLAVTASNGTVIKNPDQAGYNFGTTVTLTATPATGYSFTAWSGDATGSTNPLAVTINGNKNITANFAINRYTVTLTASPKNGGTVSGSGIYDYGSSVTIAAVAKNITGSKFQFINWTENGIEISKNTSYTFNITANKNLIANFLDITSVEDEGGIPTKFVLSQNYPNPFNPSTTIRYNLPKEAMVSIKVYDMLGREMKTLIKEYKSAGSYNVEFNASNLTSGIYFYRLTAGDFTQVKKLVLMK